MSYGVLGAQGSRAWSMGVRSNTPKVDNVLIHVDDTISPGGDLTFRCELFPTIWQSTDTQHNASYSVIVCKSKGSTLLKPHCPVSNFLVSPSSYPGPRVDFLFVRTFTLTWGLCIKNRLQSSAALQQNA